MKCSMELNKSYLNVHFEGQLSAHSNKLQDTLNILYIFDMWAHIYYLCMEELFL